MDQSFAVIVEKDPESGWLVGEVVELPGCYTQAEDISALDKNITEAIGAYLASIKGKGSPRPEFVGTWKVQVAI